MQAAPGDLVPSRNTAIRLFTFTLPLWQQSPGQLDREEDSCPSLSAWPYGTFMKIGAFHIYLP